MSSLKSLYRAAVMVATAIIVFKGWQLYGPTTDQLKSGVARALEVTQDTLDQVQPGRAQTAQANIDPRSAPILLATTPDSTTPAEPAAGVPASSVGAPSPSAATEAPQLLSGIDAASPPSPAEGEKLPALMSRLEALGAREPKLAPWGNTGKLYRFCCRANLGDSSAFSRHFESVADEPAAAVEQVVAKVEAWRLAQSSRTELR
jgi:hypothetical protein